MDNFEMFTADPTPAMVEWIALADRLQLERDLADLPALFAILEKNYFALISRGDRDPDDRAIRYPVRFVITDLVDRRTKDGFERDPAGLADLARRANARRLGVLPTLQSWVVLAEGEMIDEEIEHRDPVVDDHATVTTAAGWLGTHLDWIIAQQWSIELAQEVRSIVTDLDALGINFDGPDEKACQTADAIAEFLPISARSIERWYKAGHLTDVGKVDRKRVFIVREVRNLVESPPWERVGIKPHPLDQTSLTLGAVKTTAEPKRHLRWGSLDPRQDPNDHERIEA